MEKYIYLAIYVTSSYAIAKILCFVDDFHAIAFSYQV